MASPGRARPRTVTASVPLATRVQPPLATTQITFVRRGSTRSLAPRRAHRVRLPAMFLASALVTYGVEPTGLHTQPLRSCTAQAWVGMRVVLLVVCHRSASACPCAGIGRWYRQVRLDGLGTRLVSPTHSAADRALRASGARRATSTSGALAPVTRSSIVLRAAPTRRRCRAPQVSW